MGSCPAWNAGDGEARGRLRLEGPRSVAEVRRPVGRPAGDRGWGDVTWRAGARGSSRPVGPCRGSSGLQGTLCGREQEALTPCEPCRGEGPAPRAAARSGRDKLAGRRGRGAPGLVSVGWTGHRAAAEGRPFSPSHLLFAWPRTLPHPGRLPPRAPLRHPSKGCPQAGCPLQPDHHCLLRQTKRCPSQMHH